jgi:2-hydroxy-3-keto-5-methylthiopentenyl-1-phosphate phosphatase
MSQPRRQPVIFCDFDGTITVNDNIIAIMRHFNPPGWETILEQMMRHEKPLKQGIGEMFALLPGALKRDIIDFALGQIKIRAGFPELIEFCKERRIDFYVTSGGIDFFVYPALAPFAIDRERIFCNGSDFSGERIAITWPHPCDEHCKAQCGMCKTTIIRRFPRDKYFRILIGDSLTDFEGAKLADHVFARSHLVDLCRKLNLPHDPFETFHDIIARLEVIVDHAGT